MTTNFAATKAMFDLPEGVIYLDGNSLGPLPKGVAERVTKAITQEWGQMLIGAWNEANWMELPSKVGNRVARLIGAPEGSVVMGDTLSIKVYQALASALELVPSRRVILSDNGNFPSDLYIADGLTRSLGPDYSVKIVDPEAVIDAIDESIGVVMITETDYRTGRRHNMAQIVKNAHEVGALVVWDLAHSAGAFPVHLERDGADFAVGCSYKYLNSGPGGPAFIYVAPKHQEKARPALSGWLGHEAPFAFDLDYRPSKGVERMRVGTPPILALTALDAALDVWEGVSMEDIRETSLALQDRFIELVESGTDLVLATPRNHEDRGSQVSFRHPEAYAVMQALIKAGVVGDFRAPDTLRFGFTPLYIDMNDVEAAAKILIDIIAKGTWDRPEFKKRNKVT